MNPMEFIFEVGESPEKGFEAPALGHRILTQAATLDELREMVREAVRCHFDSETGPRLIRLHWVKHEFVPA
jgi:hypothetical protein